MNCSYDDLPISSSSSAGFKCDSPKAGVCSPDIFGMLPLGLSFTIYEVGFLVWGPSFFGRVLFAVLG